LSQSLVAVTPWARAIVMRLQYGNRLISADYLECASRRP
jgi:hypothetical protein